MDVIRPECPTRLFQVTMPNLFNCYDDISRKRFMFRVRLLSTFYELGLGPMYVFHINVWDDDSNPTVFLHVSQTKAGLHPLFLDDKAWNSLRIRKKNYIVPRMEVYPSPVDQVATKILVHFEDEVSGWDKEPTMKFCLITADERKGLVTIVAYFRLFRYQVSSNLQLLLVREPLETQTTQTQPFIVLRCTHSHRLISLDPSECQQRIPRKPFPWHFIPKAWRNDIVFVEHHPHQPGRVYMLIKKEKECHRGAFLVAFTDILSKYSCATSTIIHVSIPTLAASKNITVSVFSNNDVLFSAYAVKRNNYVEWIARMNSSGTLVCQMQSDSDMYSFRHSVDAHDHVLDVQRSLDDNQDILVTCLLFQLHTPATTTILS